MSPPRRTASTRHRSGQPAAQPAARPGSAGVPPGSALLIPAALVAAAGTTYLAVARPVLAVLPVAVLAVVLAARYPVGALITLVPVLLWPTPLEFHGWSLQTGVVIGRLPRLRAVALPAGVAAGFAALILLSAAGHGAPAFIPSGAALNSAVTLAANALLVPAVALLRPPWTVVLKAVGLSSVAVALYTLTHGTQTGGRLGLDGINPNTIGHAATLGTLSLLTLAVHTRRVRWLTVAMVPAVSAVASQSRGALLALAVGIAVLLLAMVGRRHRLPVVVLLAPAVVALAAPIRSLATTALSARSANFLSSDARVDVLHLAIGLTVDHPLLGVGYRHFLDYSAPAVGMALDTHDDYARVAVEAGLPALLLLAVVLAGGVLRGRRSLPAPLLALWVPCVLCVAFINALTDLRVTLAVWLVAGLTWVGEATRSEAVAQPAPVAVPAARAGGAGTGTGPAAGRAADRPPGPTRRASC
jgi:O-antigen ligase